MKHYYALFAILGAVLLTGCAQTTMTDDFSVATTFYPVEQATRMVVGDSVDVFSIVPPGSEPHGFEATPQDILRLNRANAFVTLGIEFEAFEEELAAAAEPTVRVISAGQGIELLQYSDDHDHGEEHHEEHADERAEGEHQEDGESDSHAEEHGEGEHDEHMEEGEHEEHGEHDHDHSGTDPHIWLSPINMQQMVLNVNQGLAEVDPANANLYQENAQASIAQLQALHEEFETALATCEKDVVLVNHNAFAYLARDYGFEVISISGLSPEVEPTPQQLTELIDEARYHDLKYLFYEELVDPRVANTIAEEVGAEVLELSPIGDEGEDYFSLMRANLANLQIALECN